MKTFEEIMEELGAPVEPALPGNTTMFYCANECGALFLPDVQADGYCYPDRYVYEGGADWSPVEGTRFDPDLCPCAKVPHEVRFEA